MNADQTTIAVYDARAEEYSSLTETPQEHPEMKAFVAALPTGARVLDLECGPGFYAAWLVRQGLRVDAQRLGKGKGLSGDIEPYILIRAHGC